MTNSPTDAAHGVDRRLQIEAILADYPAISKDELQQLLVWFNKEASSLDVGMVASNEAVRAGYNQFRSDHLDRIGMKDVGYAILLFGVVLGVAALLGYLAA